MFKFYSKEPNFINDNVMRNKHYIPSKSLKNYCQRLQYLVTGESEISLDAFPKILITECNYSLRSDLENKIRRQKNGSELEKKQK